MSNDPNQNAKSAVFKLLAEKEQPTTYKLDSSPLLDKLKMFLPEIAEANKQLENVPQKDRDIEQVEEGMRHIEMNVGMYECGDETDDQLIADNESDSESDSDSEDIVVIRSPPTPRKDMIQDMDVER